MKGLVITCWCLVFLAGCGDEADPRDEPPESTHAVGIPADPPARQVEPALVADSPPVLEVRDEAYYTARLAAIQSQVDANNQLGPWVARFRAAGGAATSFALLTFVSDDGPTADTEGRTSTWSVSTSIAGTILPATVAIFQKTLQGEVPSDGYFLGHPGLVYAAFLHPHGVMFRIVAAGDVFGFFTPRGDGDYVVANGGPTVSSADVLAQAGGW